MSMFFGPLDKTSCLYFLALSVLAFISLAIMILSLIVLAIRTPSKIDYTLLAKGVLVYINMFLVYFVNRLMYTMCVKSVI
jgi:predicted membrane channel-forming protein YqfA (hemolysin III family)